MEEKRNIDQLQAVWLAAGVLAFMAASLERAAVLYSVVKQWRSWVFVALNVLLLAILFTSKRAAFCTNPSESTTDAVDSCHRENDHTHDDSKADQTKKRLMKKQEECSRRVVDAGHDGGDQYQNLNGRMKSGGSNQDDEKIIECDDGDGSGMSNLPKPPLSKEELNERVEAFIATFRRQYLVSNEKGESRSGFYNSPATNGGGGVLSKRITV